MKYSQSLEWAICILTLLATEKRVITNEELHQRLGVSPTYLKKITRKLVVGGLIKSIYGARGGFSLARKMSDISMYDVVDSIDGHEIFFQPSGLIELVFSDIQKDKIVMGKGMLSTAFYDAQSKMNKKLKKVSMAQIIKAIRKLNNS